MTGDYFEKAFSNFIDRTEYDQAEEALFAIIRSAYIAGWEAAKREIHLMPKIAVPSSTQENTKKSPR